MEMGFVYNYTTPGNAHINTLIGGDISMSENNGPRTSISAGSVIVGYPAGGNSIEIDAESVTGNNSSGISFMLNENGVTLRGGDNDHVLTSDCSTIDIREYARRSELPTTATKESLGVVKVGDGLNVTDGTISVDTTVLPAVPTNVSQLTNDSNFITAADADSRYALSATADSLRVGLSKK
jgi:hypothetical protein